MVRLHDIIYLLYSLGTPSASSLRGNSLSSTASHRSSPFLNLATNPKEPTGQSPVLTNFNNVQQRSSLESPSAVNRAVAQLTGHSNGYASSINTSSGSPSPVAMLLRNSHPVSSGSSVSSPNQGTFVGNAYSGSLAAPTSSSASSSSVASLSLSQPPAVLTQGKYAYILNKCSWALFS